MRFTLPGFEREPGALIRSTSWSTPLRRVIEQTCPGERVTLLLHDSGCVFGYQFAKRHPQLVERVIGVDIGDAGSRQQPRENVIEGQADDRGLSMVARACVAHRRPLGDRWRAGWRSCAAPAPPQEHRRDMGYPYAMQWFGVRAASVHCAVRSQLPMLFFYGERKPFMFHSTHGARSCSRPGNRWSGCRPALGDGAAAERVQRRGARLARRDGRSQV